MKTLALDKIRIDGGTQPRESIDTAYVTELAEVADKLPAAVVFFDGTDHWLADGFHRYHARRQANKSSLSVEIKEGTVREAILYSVGANADHGLRRSNADKRRAAEMLLGDDEWGKKSDRWIADQCAVTHTFVSSLRKSTGNGCQLKRVGKDGKTRAMPPKKAPEIKMEAAAVPDVAEISMDAPPARAAPPSEIEAMITRAGELEELAKAVAKVKAAVKAGVEGKDELYSGLNWNQLEADFNNIWRAIRFAKPFAVCCYCNGLGREDKSCKACRGFGWLGEGMYDAAPGDLKK